MHHFRFCDLFEYPVWVLLLCNVMCVYNDGNIEVGDTVCAVRQGGQGE